MLDKRHPDEERFLNIMRYTIVGTDSPQKQIAMRSRGSWIRAFLPATLAAALWACAGPASSLVLVQQGKPSCTIIVPAEKNSIIQSAAEDLRDHLRKISGAEVPVVSNGREIKGVRIYVGVAPSGLKLPVDLTDRQLFWPDGYLIMTNGERLCLLSPRPEGVSNAVYGLLEDFLGCHWFTPGEIGMVTPRRSVVEVKIPGGYRVVRPSFEMRSPWYNGNAGARQTPEEATQMNLWRLRNRAGGMQGYAGQDWVSIFPKDLQEREPGLQAMINGKRAPHGSEAQICMSYPRAVEIAAGYFIGLFANHPTLDYYTFSANDNDSWCQCPDCVALGANPAERMMVFTNKVAAAVALKCPGKGITTLPYSSTIEPPVRDLKGESNLYPVLCSYSMEQVKPKTQENDWCNTYRRRVERWMELLPRAWSYDYIGWYPGPWTLFHKLEAEQEYYRKHRFTGMMPEYLDRNLGTDVHAWLSFRIAWDKNLRVGDLLSLFYPAYFGAAANDMRALYEKFEKQMLATGGTGEVMDVPRLYPIPLIEEALTRIASAKRKVATDATICARLERDENCLKLTRLWLDFWTSSASFRRSGTPEHKQRAAQSGLSYLQLLDSLDGTLTVGKAARGYVASSLEALNDPGTLFSKAGSFQYMDGLDDGGKSFQAKSRSGFSIGTYGLGLAPGATGEVVYDLRAGEGLKFKEARLVSMYFTLPLNGHNLVDLSVDEGRTWITVCRDTPMAGGTAEYELTKPIAGTRQFLLRFSIQNSEKEILGMDNWGIAGVVE
ncbi:MAG: DUF4838 domain-containing protein [Armatimonadetes bacterium]|nr:DUF4838 domain-containing protein [Armatimonadota bacterium]